MICKLCNKEFKKITNSHLLTFHNITYKEYKEKYLKSDEITIEELSEDNFKDYDSILSLKKEKKIRKIYGYEDPIMDNKIDILNFLEDKYGEVKNNFEILIMSNRNKILYNFITDISIPSRKINFEFVNSFWHNNQINFSKDFRDEILKKYDWKIFNIEDPNPTIESISNIIN